MQVIVDSCLKSHTGIMLWIKYDREISVYFQVLQDKLSMRLKSNTNKKKEKFFFINIGLF